MTSRASDYSNARTFALPSAKCLVSRGNILQNVVQFVAFFFSHKLLNSYYLYLLILTSGIASKSRDSVNYRNIKFYARILF